METNQMNYCCDQPYDLDCKFNLRIVLSRKQIIDSMRKYTHKTLTDDEHIDEWLIINWGSKTDMPPGHYISRIRSNKP
jgi:predicted RNA binding protein with dsRBD fold (UPF0201 family)